ncbi:hypothetical protein [Nannocystis sp. SCPEA4]|uniref:hypothetical protein n=1 Tax=Nannocystis sp. SCPEA4 TaxID=2996787 RepID=UPI00226DC7CA|nr:hypothetical protein [Nannocystis sp. SCPEA4]MCY1062957.1 hypothetical protein [Nannocystis sp. SCPEA4]
MNNPLRSAHPVLSVVLIGAVALAPVADVQASPLRIRSAIALQPAEGEEAAAAEAPAPAPAEGPAAEGPAPAPVAAPPPGPPPKKGLGMMITGAVLTGAYALPLIGYGAYAVAIGKKADDATGNTGAVETGGNIVGGVLLTMGIIGLAVGAPLLGVGAARFSKYQKWKKGQQALFLPSAGRTPFGTITPGFEIRF